MTLADLHAENTRLRLELEQAQQRIVCLVGMLHLLKELLERSPTQKKAPEGESGAVG